MVKWLKQTGYKYLKLLCAHVKVPNIMHTSRVQYILHFNQCDGNKVLIVLLNLYGGTMILGLHNDCTIRRGFVHQGHDYVACRDIARVIVRHILLPPNKMLHIIHMSLTCGVMV